MLGFERSKSCQGCSQFGIGHDNLQIARRAEANLLKRDGENLSIVQAVGRSHYTPFTRQAVRQTEIGRPVVAVAGVRKNVEFVHLHRTQHRLVAQAVVQRQVGTRAPGVSREVLHVPVAEPTVEITDRQQILRGRAHPQVGDGVATEVIAVNEKYPRYESVSSPFS